MIYITIVPSFINFEVLRKYTGNNIGHGAIPDLFNMLLLNEISPSLVDVCLQILEWNIFCSSIKLAMFSCF